VHKVYFAAKVVMFPVAVFDSERYYLWARGVYILRIYVDAVQEFFYITNGYGFIYHCVYLLAKDLVCILSLIEIHTIVIIAG
jgi:hypothetical protein